MRQAGQSGGAGAEGENVEYVGMKGQGLDHLVLAQRKTGITDSVAWHGPTTFG